MNTLKFGNGEWYGKKDTILAYNDENSNYKPLPFDFSRGSTPTGSKATTINKDGLIEEVGNNIPRIDYKDNTKGALLLEPSRTNRMPNSEDGSTWTLSNVTLSSLSGGLNKEYYQITSLGNTGRFDVVSNNWVNLTAGTYTASVFAKKGTSDQIILTTRANYSSQSAYSVFNLTSGTVVSNNGVTGSIEPYSDGWYRCAITFTNSGSYTDFASFAFGFNFNSSSTDTLFVASPQSEIGSYPTSYIPTSGSAVTRLADVCNNGGNEQVINSTEGTIYFEGNAINNDNTNKRISLSDGSSSNRIVLTFANNTITYGLVSGGGLSSNIVYNSDTTINKKYAFTWKLNEFKFWVNGVQVGVDTSGAVFPLNTLYEFSFADYTSTTSTFYGKTKDIRVYDNSLTDQELAALTQV